MESITKLHEVGSFIGSCRIDDPSFYKGLIR
jgi:hypothetical protein